MRKTGSEAEEAESKRKGSEEEEAEKTHETRDSPATFSGSLTLTVDAVGFTREFPRKSSVIDTCT